jgi:cytokinin dehydrogenase
MSAVTPDSDEEIFYVASFLWNTLDNNTQTLTEANNQVVKVCEEYNFGCKLYLPHFTSQEGWIKQYGHKWGRFVSWKRKYDPIAIMSPGHKIFTPLVLV